MGTMRAWYALIMRSAFAVVTTLALVGCSGLNGSVTTAPEVPTMVPVGVSSESTMLACRTESDDCLRVSVISDGATVERMRNDSGEWIMIAESACRNGMCTATDEFGGKWRLEP